jgi:hypothetical protein
VKLRRWLKVVACGLLCLADEFNMFGGTQMGAPGPHAPPTRPTP